MSSPQCVQKLNLSVNAKQFLDHVVLVGFPPSLLWLVKKDSTRSLAWHCQGNPSGMKHPEPWSAVTMATWHFQTLQATLLASAAVNDSDGKGPLLFFH